MNLLSVACADHNKDKKLGNDGRARTQAIMTLLRLAQLLVAFPAEVSKVRCRNQVYCHNKGLPCEYFVPDLIAG